MSTLVPPGDLASAVSLNGVAMNSARVVGPSIADILIETVRTTSCFAVNALSYVAVIAALVTVHPPHKAEQRRRARAASATGEAGSNCGLPLTMRSLVGLFARSTSQSCFRYSPRQDFIGSGGTYGLMLSLGSIAGSFGVGLIGNILIGWISSGVGPRAALLAGTAACLVAAALGALVHIPPDPDAQLTDLS